MTIRALAWASCVLAGLAAGCAVPGEDLTAHGSPQTGAKQAAQTWFEALVRKDWPMAYQVLDAGSKARCNAGRFAQLGEAYHRNLGFEPSEANLQGCDERGATAIAHAILKGLAGSSPAFYKDAVALSRTESGWAVVLPANFGQVRAKRK